jgi:methylmalonyl-CoA mutase cobalamin-binding subunit
MKLSAAIYGVQAAQLALLLATEERAAQAADTLSIADAERVTGIKKETLRVWERRYGFPAPSRDTHGNREYPQAQIDRLRLIKRLLDEAGLRSGLVLPLDMEALQALANELLGPPAEASPSDSQSTNLQTAGVHELLAAARHPDAAALRRRLGQSQARLGSARFVTDIVAPLNMAVGEAWMDGSLPAFQAHLYSALVQTVMHHALGNLPAAAPGARPRVVLTALAGEPHGMGLLMTETVFAIEGCACVSLGLRAPARDCAMAAAAHRADILVLSRSRYISQDDLTSALTDMRQRLDPGIELWVVASAPALQPQDTEGMLSIEALGAVAAEVQRWRDQHHGTSRHRPDLVPAGA